LPCRYVSLTVGQKRASSPSCSYLCVTAILEAILEPPLNRAFEKLGIVCLLDRLGQSQFSKTTYYVLPCDGCVLRIMMGSANFWGVRDVV
jgi:hypothetical protein